MGKIKIKKKLRAQRKFAQGAIIPQQHNHTAPARSASHRSPAPSGPVIKHNISVTTLLNVISLRGVHEAYHPIPYLDHQSPPIEERSPEQSSPIKKKKFKVKDKNIKTVVKKQYSSSILRNRRPSNASASVSDSGEENQPLTYYQSKNNEETKNQSETSPVSLSEKQVSGTGEPNILNIDKDLENTKNHSNTVFKPLLTCKEAHVSITDVIVSVGKKELKKKAVLKARKDSRESASCNRKSEDRASTDSDSKTSPGSKLKSQREKRQVKTHKEFAYNPEANSKSRKSDARKSYPDFPCKKSILPANRPLKKLRALNKKARLEQLNKKVKIVRKKKEDCTRGDVVVKRSEKSVADSVPVRAASISSGNGALEKLFDDTDDESVERVSTWVSKIIRTVGDDAEETSGECGDTNDSFKKPMLPARFRKRPPGLCPTREHPCLMSLLESRAKSDEQLCGSCRRCQLISKYWSVRDLLPQTEPNDTDMSLNTPVTDVYDFESDESGLKVLRRGRELVRNVLAKNTFSYWLCNLDMHLNKDMFRDHGQLPKLKRNLVLTEDPQDDIILKVINRVDYLSQCIMEDKKESTCESSRKRLRSSGRSNTTASNKHPDTRKKTKLLFRKQQKPATLQQKPATLQPIVKLTSIEPEKTVEVDKPSQALRPVVCLTPLEISKSDEAPADPEMSPELVPLRRGRKLKSTKFTFATLDTSNSNAVAVPPVKENNIKGSTEKIVPASQVSSGKPVLVQAAERIVAITPDPAKNNIILDYKSPTKQNLIPALQGTTDKNFIPAPQVRLEKNIISGLQSSAPNIPVSAPHIEHGNKITVQGAIQNNFVPEPHVTIEKMLVPNLHSLIEKIIVPKAQFTNDDKVFPLVVLEKNMTASQDAKDKSIVRAPQVALENNLTMSTHATTEKNLISIPQVILGQSPVILPQVKNLHSTTDKKFPQVIIEKNPALIPPPTKTQALLSTKEKNFATIPQVALEKIPSLTNQVSNDKVPLVALEKNSALVAQASKKSTSALQSAKDKNGISISQVTVDINVVTALSNTVSQIVQDKDVLVSQCLPQDVKNNIVVRDVISKNFSVSHVTLEKDLIAQGTINPAQDTTADLMATVPTPPKVCSAVNGVTTQQVPNKPQISTALYLPTPSTVPITSTPATTTVPAATIPEAVNTKTSAIVYAEPTKPPFSIDLSTTVPLVTTAPALTTASLPTANPTSKPPTKIGRVVGAPVFRPTEEEFKDPIGYIEKIEGEASAFGICKIVLPDKVPYNLDQSVMFKTTNQYVGRLYQRWGATARVMATIQVLMALTEKSDKSKQPPNLDGIEVDLVKLYRLVRDKGGIQELMGDRAQWLRVAEEMSMVADKARATLDGRKLEKIYIKNILPYESLSDTDRMKIHAQVDQVWTERLRRGLRRASRPLHYQRRLLGDTASSDEDDAPTDEAAPVRQLGKHVLDRAEECLSHTGRSNLDSFRKRAGDLQHMRFPDNPSPSPQEVEDQYWRLLCLCKEHVVVQTAAIDTSVGRMGHEADPALPGGDHPWNMKRVTESPRNVLRSLGKSLSVTVPTLCLNHLFSTNCWHMDPHQLAWVDCMHEGKPKIWYAVAARHAMRFRHAMEAMAPSAVQRKGLWLPSDTAMVPPALLSLHGVNMTKVYQEPGEYIVVFPGAYFSSIATGLSISESIYFGSLNWLRNMDRIFDEMREDCEPSMFSLAALLLRVASEATPEPRVARLALPPLRALVRGELARRRRAAVLGMRLLTDESGLHRPITTSWPNQPECSLCRVPLILSKANRIDNRSLVCLTHGLRLFELTSPSERPKVPPPVTLLYSDQKLITVLRNLETKVQTASPGLL